MTTTDLADRLTSALEAAFEALDTLDQGRGIVAPVHQGAVNTLRKVIGDLSTLANDTRQAAHDEAQKLAEDKTAAAKSPVTGTSTAAGSGSTSTSKS